MKPYQWASIIGMLIAATAFAFTTFEQKADHVKDAQDTGERLKSIEAKQDRLIELMLRRRI